MSDEIKVGDVVEVKFMGIVEKIDADANDDLPYLVKTAGASIWLPKRPVSKLGSAASAGTDIEQLQDATIALQRGIIEKSNEIIGRLRAAIKSKDESTSLMYDEMTDAFVKQAETIKELKTALSHYEKQELERIREQYLAMKPWR